MLTQSQLETRTKYVGGSDAGAILGCNPYTTRLKVYESKVIPPDPDAPDLADENEAVLWGNVLEKAIAGEFCRRLDLQYMEPKGPYYHQDYKFLGGLVDRLIVSTQDTGILEVKNMSDGMYYYLQNMGLEFAPWHFAQIQHYFNVTGLKWGYLTYLVGGNKLVNTQVDRDDAYIALMETAEVDFWNECVVPQLQPEPTSSDDLDRMFKKAEVHEIEANAVALEDYKELVQIQKEKKEAEANLERQKSKIKLYLRSSNLLTHQGKPLVSWNNVSTTRIDSKLLKSKYPRVAKECSNTTAGRRIYIYD